MAPKQVTGRGPARWARAVLVVDGAGCLAAGAALAVPAVGARVALRGRWPAVAALALTGAGLLAGARDPRPASLILAGVVNAGWVATCLRATSGRDDAVGRGVLVTTAVLDAAAGGLQLALGVRAALDGRRSGGGGRTGGANLA